MKKVPKMISTKDLSYICDIFNWNLTASIKLNEFVNICEDKDVCTELNKTIDLHESNCQKLIKLLESCGSNGR